MPNSSDAYKNAFAYKTAWDKQVELLFLTIDDIIDINDYLAVCENHILEDINICLLFLHDQNQVEFKANSGFVLSHTDRVCDLVKSELENYEPCDFIQNVTEIAYILKTNTLTNFARSVEYYTQASQTNFNENDFIGNICPRLLWYLNFKFNLYFNL